MPKPLGRAPTTPAAPAPRGQPSPSDDSTAEATDSLDSPSMAFLRELAHVSNQAPPGLEPALEPPLEGEEAGRFLLQRRLGEGGFGVVFEALDRERSAVVALKVLRQRDPRALYRFKHEFRALVETVHPHLVQLFELYAERERCFFTMELVRGRHAVRRSEGPVPEPELRSIFAQLSDGLGFLHAAGKLHCDIKPSNVMLGDDGRVVLLDFGLLTEIGGASGSGAGTPAYMAPEQADGRPVGPAADAFAMGVMLFEALTGRLPFSGRDRLAPPPRPSAITPSVPADLEALCLDLLSPEPQARPSMDEARRRLSASSYASYASRPQASARPRPGEHGFWGRHEELSRLRDAFAEARGGKTVVALVHGPTGIGKSALLGQFLASLGPGEAALTLAGKCFQQESLPYKGLDGLIDALSRHLRETPAAELSPVLPANIGALARIFPAMAQLPGASRDEPGGDDEARRRRGIGALRELLTRIARRATPVLVIDDLQFGDLDSASLLIELISPPAAPPLLFVASFRDEDAASSPSLRALLEGLCGEPRSAEGPLDLPLGPLEQGDSEALVSSILGRATKGARRVGAIVAEGKGHPFFLAELSRMAEAGELGEAGWPGLDALFAARVRALPSPARRMLELIASAGQPIERAVVARAAYGAATETDEPKALSTLAAMRLVRFQEATVETLDVYHDRIRDVSLSGLSAEQSRGLHLALAETLEASDKTEPERLVEHFSRAGLRPRAARYAVLAADRAREALAFDRAARLYRRALELGARPEQERALKVRLADSLSSLGRPKEAAEAYLEASAGAPALEAIRLEQRAFEQLLLGGYTEQGLSVLGPVASRLGIAPPSSKPALALSIGLLEARLRVRGLRFVEQSEQSIPAETLLAIDACWSAAAGLALVDPLAAAHYQARHLRLALDAGEPYRISRALALEGVLRTWRGLPLSEERLELARTLSARAGHPHALGLVTLLSSAHALISGGFLEAASLAQRAKAIFRERCAGVAWELDLADLFICFSLWMQGEIRTLTETLSSSLHDARERGSLHRETMLVLNGAPVVHLSADRPDLARAQIEEALERWASRALRLQHARGLAARVRIALYDGRPDEAWEALERGWPEVRRAGLLRLPIIRFEMRFCRAITALACAEQGRPELLALALADARWLSLGEVPWSIPFGLSLEGAVAMKRGDQAAALEALEASERGFIERDMPVLGALLRLRRAQWSGERGRRLVEGTSDWLMAQGIRRPDRLATMLLGPE